MAMMLSKMQPYPHGMFDFLRELIATDDGLILFLLGLIVAMEIIDFFSGTFAAIVNPSRITPAHAGKTLLVQHLKLFLHLKQLAQPHLQTH